MSQSLETESSSSAPKVVQWDDLETDLVRLVQTSSISSHLRTKREALSNRLQAALQERKASLRRIDELEALKFKLKSKEGLLQLAKLSLQENLKQETRIKEKLFPSAQSLLVAARALAVAKHRLQEADRLLSGEGGHGRLLHVKKMLVARRRLMITQVTAIYPLAPCSTMIPSSLPIDNQQSKDAVADRLVDFIPMSIGGLRVLSPLNRTSGLYNDRSDREASATALGYAAHVVSLISSYLDVHLRYPIRFGASRSYIQDPVLVGESATSGASEFPLFSDGQDPTRAAYAVFLLNKDLEQTLNRLGSESIGPRHTLPNLNKIIQLVCSGVQVN